jgi:hypothetical protein
MQTVTAVIDPHPSQFEAAGVSPDNVVSFEHGNMCEAAPRQLMSRA